MERHNQSAEAYEFLFSVFAQADRELVAAEKAGAPRIDLLTKFRDVIQAKLNLCEAFPPMTWSKQQRKDIQSIGFIPTWFD